MDRYETRTSWLKAWGGWCSSTIALAQLQRAIGFTVPVFKRHAAVLFEEVGVALARADEAALARLTTPSCLATMRVALKARPRGQRHAWISHGVDASIKQIRLGHSSRDRTRKFAQVTCSIEARMVYEIRDGAGKLVGSTGSEDAPHALTDLWVMERVLVEGGTWRLKERLGSLSELTPQQAESAAG
jgi:predicted lipid-binding transport protein (Tim44 family)